MSDSHKVIKTSPPQNNNLINDLEMISRRNTGISLPVPPYPSKDSKHMHNEGFLVSLLFFLVILVILVLVVIGIIKLPPVYPPAIQSTSKVAS